MLAAGARFFKTRFRQQCRTPVRRDPAVRRCDGRWSGCCSAARPSSIRCTAARRGACARSRARSPTGTCWAVLAPAILCARSALSARASGMVVAVAARPVRGRAWCSPRSRSRIRTGLGQLVPESADDAAATSSVLAQFHIQVATFWVILGIGAAFEYYAQVPRARASRVAARVAPRAGAARGAAHAAAAPLPVQHAAHDLGVHAGGRDRERRTA